jgi:hypothetical protein
MLLSSRLVLQQMFFQASWLFFTWTVAAVTIDAPNQPVGVVTSVPLIKPVGFPDGVLTTATTPGSTALVLLLPLNGCCWYSFSFFHQAGWCCKDCSCSQYD